jgi:hypothetical protein
MITIKDIKKWSKQHPIGKGRITRIENKSIEFSIIGGHVGFYGDFEKTFELAILDKESGEFLTRFFYPEAQDDVISYMEDEEVELLVNQLIKGNDFQVR